MRRESVTRICLDRATVFSSPMFSLLSLVLLGFLLGMRHATDPDHVVAVTTIVSRERSLRAAAPIGAFWGLGHTLTILVVGGAIILFKIAIPVRLGLGMELAVALMLVLLGVWSLGRRGRSHDHAHVKAAPQGRSRKWQWARSLIVGLVHGLAGSAAVALLVLGTIHEPRWGVAYLLVFGLGTIAGMFVITSALALPLAYTAGKFDRFHRTLGAAAAIASVGFGCFLVYDIGFEHGLFTAHPQWTPE